MTIEFQPHIPFDNHGTCAVVLLTLKDHPKRVYHYSKTIGEEESWAVRDYITGMIVRSGDSTLTASQIEKMIEYSDDPAYRSVKMIAKWKADCLAASERHFGAHVDATNRNPPTLGVWRKMNNQGS